MSDIRDPKALDEARLLQLFDALPRAIVVTTPDGEIILWNATAERTYGWTADEVVGRSVLDVLIPGYERERGAEIIDGLEAGRGWDGDVTVLHRDGTPMRVWVTERPIVDEDGRVTAALGASEDVTELRLIEQRNEDLHQHLRLALDAGGLGTWRWDMATGVTEWDDTTYRLFGIEPGDANVTFDEWVARLHPDDAPDVLRHVEEAVATKGGYVIEHRVVWPDGTVRWLQGSGKVTLDAAGEVTGTIGAIRDVTERMEGELERSRLVADALRAADEERLNRERLEFLAAINDELVEARDQSDVATRAVRAAVPRLGDWCAIFVLPAGSDVPDVEVAHVDPEQEALARRLHEDHPYDPAAATGMPRVIRTGVAELYAEIDDEVLDRSGVPPDQAEVARQLGIRSAMAVPIVKRGRVLGGIQFVATSARRGYTADDLALARTVAGRIASSLDNHRLQAAQRTIAATLQSSLLPFDLPEVPGLDLAVRYRAAGEGIDVGGDFYDLFQIDDERWGVVIGDVCGTGPLAAALTGMVRHTVASAAWHGDDPVEVLHHVNRAMLDRGTGSFCTVAFGVVRPTPAGVELSLAVGGHPRPVVVSRDGTTSTLGRPGTLVGVFDDFRAALHRSVIEPGQTVVFYTDGATDVAPPHHLEPEDFAALVARAAAGDVDAAGVATRVEAALGDVLGFGLRTDDVALLVLRAKEPEARMADERPGRGSVSGGTESGMRMRTITDSSCTWTAPATSRSVKALRRSVEAWLVEHGVTPGALDDWRLVVSELAANACQNAAPRGEVILTVAEDADRVVLVVRNPVDHEVGDLAPRDPGPLANRGRGLHIVDELADGLRIEVADGWVEVTCWLQAVDRSVH